MLKMVSHDPFGYLKHKLWPKERTGVKLPIWLPTTKSWELPWFTCVQVACHILLESSWWGIQLDLDFTSIRGLHKKLWASKVTGVPILRLSTFESQDKMTFGCRPHGQAQKNYKREGDGFPQICVVVSLVSLCLLMFHLCTKCALTMH
jgi:hypothetical protein